MKHQRNYRNDHLLGDSLSTYEATVDQSSDHIPSSSPSQMFEEQSYDSMILLTTAHRSYVSSLVKGK